MKKLGLILSFFLLCGCTYSINMVHSEGQATDVIDETQTNEPDISPEITIPAGAI